MTPFERAQVPGVTPQQWTLFEQLVRSDGAVLTVPLLRIAAAMRRDDASALLEAPRHTTCIKPATC